MENTLLFRARYTELQKSRPSVYTAGIWFSLVYLLSRILFLIAFLGLCATILWTLKIIEFKGLYGTILNQDALKIIAASGCVFGMLISGFSARMCRRVVARNGYIAELELLLEETVLREETEVER